jgi:hypothetical protein
VLRPSRGLKPVWPQTEPLEVLRKKWLNAHANEPYRHARNLAGLPSREADPSGSAQEDRVRPFVIPMLRSADSVHRGTCLTDKTVWLDTFRLQDAEAHPAGEDDELARLLAGSRSVRLWLAYGKRSSTGGRSGLSREIRGVSSPRWTSASTRATSWRPWTWPLIAAATVGKALVDDECAKKAVAELTRDRAIIASVDARLMFSGRLASRVCPGCPRHGAD